MNGKLKKLISLFAGMMLLVSCGDVNGGKADAAKQDVNLSELEQKYHDEEWAVPVHDDKKLFKMLILEGKQAGLSWTTILSKMDTLCEAFDDFDPNIIIKYDCKKVENLLNNE